MSLLRQRLLERLLKKRTTRRSWWKSSSPGGIRVSRRTSEMPSRQSTVCSSRPWPRTSSRATVPEARLPGRPAGRALSLEDESLPGAKLRSPGSPGVAGLPRRPYPTRDNTGPSSTATMPTARAEPGVAQCSGHRRGRRAPPALLAHLGAADRQGLRGRSTHLHPLRRQDGRRRLRHGPTRDPPHPRPPRPLTAGPEAPASPTETASCPWTTRAASWSL